MNVYSTKKKHLYNKKKHTCVFDKKKFRLKSKQKHLKKKPCFHGLGMFWRLGASARPILRYVCSPLTPMLLLV